MRTTCRFAPLALVIAGAFAPVEAADVRATLKNEINKNPSAKAAVLQAAGIADPKNWSVTAVEFKLKPGRIKLKIPPARLEFITSDEILNCEDTSVTRSITLAKEVTNSSSTTVTQGFETTDELKLSVEYEGIGGGYTGSQKISTSVATAQTTQTVQKIEEVTTIAFDKRGGRISVLQAMIIDARQIPWSVSLTPDDTEPVVVTAQAAAGRVCFYQHTNYTGKELCVDAPAEDNNIGVKLNNKVSSIKVEGNASLVVHSIIGYRGDTATYTASTANIGATWNDRISSFKLAKGVRTKSVPFGQVKVNLPENARTFKASGTMTVSETRPEGKRITNYGVPEADLVKACANAPTLAIAADAKASTASAKPGGKGLVRRELPKDEAMRRIATAPKL